VPYCGVLAFGCVLAVLGCGGEDEESDPVVPIEDIPEDKRIVDLTEAEERGVCDWASSVARDLLPPPGTVIDCGGIEIRMNAPSCTFPNNGLPGCDATLAEYMLCVPSFMSRIATDPCQLLDITSDAAAREFVETTPNCEGLGPCATAL
jgi:hypothetical protein